mgnify:FL=1
MSRPIHTLSSKLPDLSIFKRSGKMQDIRIYSAKPGTGYSVMVSQIFNYLHLQGKRCIESPYKSRKGFYIGMEISSSSPEYFKMQTGHKRQVIDHQTAKIIADGGGEDLPYWGESKEIMGVELTPCGKDYKL